MSDLLTHQKAKGALSEAVTTSDFYVWWMKQPASKGKGYLGSPNLRTDARDRIFEAYLKSKALGPNGIAFMLAPKHNPLCDVNPQTSLRDFHQVLKETYPNPLPVLIDMLKAIGVPVKDIKDEITGEHIDQSEEALKIMVRVKQGGKRQPKHFEGTYHNTDLGHYKFWTLTYIGGAEPYRATWGKIGKAVQGHKDYTEAKAAELASLKQREGYEKQ